MSIDDSVQVKCNRCKNAFRERARRLQNGYSRQCPSCEVVLFFDEDSQNPAIKLVMRQARRVRKELRELEVAALVMPSPSSGSRLRSGRGRSQARSED